MEIIVPSAISGTLAGKRFAIVGFEREAAEKIAAICASVNAFGRVVAPPDPSVALVHLAPYDICVIRATREPAGALIAAADLIARSGKAMVLIGTRDEVMGQVLTPRAAAHDFLVEPWEPGDPLMRSFRVLFRAGDGLADDGRSDGGASVIVADYDPTVRTWFRPSCATTRSNAKSRATAPKRSR